MFKDKDYPIVCDNWLPIILLTAAAGVSLTYGENMLLGN